MDKKIFFLLFFFSISTTFAAEKIPVQIYKGPIYNIFFHPLIAYPDLAFSCKNSSLKYIDSWFVTVNEFNKIIPELYHRGFVLFSPKDLFLESKDAQGSVTLTRKKITLPKGKKPLILSLDDYNFYHTMKMCGTVYRFSVDKDKLVTITDRHNNQAIIRDDQEVPNLLEKFIAQHPDFSYNNARGIIALTGYNGILGYSINKPLSKNYTSQLNEAKAVIKKLKQMGWEFASHSYFHLNQKSQGEQAFELSEKRWQNEVGSLVGPTPYYIFPYGDSWDENPIRMKFLKSIGYKYYFSVSQIPSLTIKSGAVIMERFPMDGRSLRGKYFGCKLYVNPNTILDASRFSMKH